MKQLKLLIFVSMFLTANFVWANLPYPIIFVHGLSSDHETWEETISNIQEFGELGDPYVYHICLNHDCDNGEAEYESDVEPLGWTNFNNEIVNEGNIPANTSLFAVNFNEDVFNDIWDDENYNHSNTAAIVKQGFALQYMIREVISITNCEKVVLIGHSMGGLAIREYLQRTVDDEHIWWFADDEESGHRVARVITLGTPHLGVNFGDVVRAQVRRDDAVPDLLGEACRDLLSIIEDGDDVFEGVYLFGGTEEMFSPEWWNWDYHNADVNCNGNVYDQIVGINENNNTIANDNIPLPNDIFYTWIRFIAREEDMDDLAWYEEALLDMIIQDEGEGDGVVQLSSQALYSEDGTHPNGISNTIQYFGVHTRETNNFEAVITGMDEPNIPAFAYHIFPDEDYKGFTTIPIEEDNNIDTDFYYFQSDLNGIAVIQIESIHNQNNWSLQIGQVINNEFEVIDEISNEDPQNRELSIEVEDDERYYLCYSSLPLGNSYEHPYEFSVELEEILEPELYNGRVSQEIGDENTRFFLSVYYRGSRAPNNVFLHINDDDPRRLGNQGDDWLNGVRFFGHVIPGQIGEYEFYFTASVGDVELRYPEDEDENLMFIVATDANLRITQTGISDFPVIRCFLCVEDEEGEPLVDLDEDDFTVIEDGEEVEDFILSGEGEGEGISVSTALVMDYSGSMNGQPIIDVQNACVHYVNFMRDDDRTAVIKFSDGVEMVQAFTEDQNALTNAIRAHWNGAGGGTSLMGAIYEGISWTINEREPKAIIALTDGQAGDGGRIDEVIAHSRNTHIPVYTIGLGDVNPQFLQRIANETGGLYYHAPSPDNLEEIYETISGVLFATYQIEYESPNPEPDGTEREIRIRVSHEGYVGEDTDSYTAPAPEMTVEWSEAFGYPEIIDWNAGFPDIFVENNYEVEVSITNTGNWELEGTNIELDNEHFTFDVDEFTLEPEENQNISITFSSEEAAQYNSALQITSNDPDGIFELPLHAAAFSPPVIVISEEDLNIEENLRSGDVEERSIVIRNEGGCNLRFETVGEIVGEPDRDRPLQVRHVGPVNLACVIEPLEDKLQSRMKLDMAKQDEVAKWQQYFAKIEDEFVGPVRDDLGGPDDFGYIWRDNEEDNGPEFDWMDITDVGQRLQASDDWNSGSLDLGWEFTWYDEVHDHFRVCSNGWLTFDVNFGGNTISLPQAPNQGQPNSLLLINNYDLNPSAGGSMYYWTNQQNMAVVSWIDVPQYSNNGIRSTFQVILQKQGDRCTVLYQYGHQQNYSGSNSNIGFEGPDGQNGININYRQVGSVRDGLAIAISNTWIDWMTWEPMEGMVAPDNDLEIVITFDLTDLLGGDYEAVLHTLSNDPENPDVEVTILIHVTGISEIAVEWTEDAGYPNLIDYNLIFEDIFVEDIYEIPLTVTNTGTADLEVTDISFDNDCFSAEPAEFNLAPEENAEVILSFETDEAGDYDATITIENNSEDQPEFEIPIHAEAFGPPVIRLEPQDIYVSLHPDEQTERTACLYNDGGAVLRWEGDIELVNEPERDQQERSVRRIDEQVGPHRDNAGDLLHQFESPLREVGGMAFDGELLWGSSYGSNRIAASTLEGEQVHLFNVNNNPISMTFDGELLWISSWNTNQIYRYDLDGNRVDQFNVNFQQIAGMGSDRNQYVFMNSLDDNRIHVISIENHQPVTSFTYRESMDNANIYGIDWVPEHPDGQLWGNTSGRVYQVLVDDNWNTHAVQNFAWRTDQPYNEPCHDSENLWHGMWGRNTWYMYDDGIEELRWIDCDPIAGEIEAGEHTDITLSFNAENLREGAYDAEIRFQSNDPENQEIVLEAHLLVIENGGEIELSEDRHSFREVELGGRATWSLEVLNSGESPLLIEALNTQGDYFSTNRRLSREVEYHPFALREAFPSADLADDNRLNAVVFTGDHYYVAGGNNGEQINLIHIFNRDGSYDGSFEQPNESRYGMRDLTWDGELLWGVDDGVVYGFTIEGEPVADFEIPRNFSRCIAWDPELEIFWFANITTDIVGFDREGNEIERIDRPAGLRIYGLAWHGDDPDGCKLYLSTSEGDFGHRIYKANLNTGDFTFVTDLHLIEGRSGGINVSEDWDNRTWVLTEVVNGNPDHVAVWQLDNRIRLDQDESADIEVTFAPLEEGNFNGQLIIYSNDPQNDIVNVRLSGIGVGELVPDLRHFTDFRQTDSDHSLLITALTSEGEPVTTGWEVGVFTPNNLLAGAAVWEDGERLGFAAWGDEQDGEIDGFRADELINFRVWDDEADVEYFASTTIVSGPAVWTANALTVLSLEADQGRELIVSFNEGWNMISINVTPPENMWEEEDGPDIILMTEQLRIDEENHHIELMKDGEGRFYSPVWGFNNIPFWNLVEGYQVKIDEDIETTWSGIPIPADDDIPLNPNWNIVAYFPTYQLDASAPNFYVLSPIIDFVKLAKDGQGRFLSPEFNFSNMMPWRETQGYQVKLEAEEPIVLNYPREQEEGAALAVAETFGENDSYWATPVSTGENMSILLTSVKGMNINDGDQIAAFCSSGLLVGTGKVIDGRCGLAVWGDDQSTEVKDGLLPYEAFRLHLWNDVREVEIALETGIIIEGSGLVYETDSFVALEVTVIAAVPDAYYLSSAYPNPFNAMTRLRYDVPEASQVSIRVYDIAGRMVATLFDGEQNAGYHEAIWNSRDIATGIYLIRMESNGFYSVCKVALMK